MKIESTNEIENKLFDRKEVVFNIEHGKSATPSRTQVREELAKILKLDKDLIVIQYIRSSFGIGVSSCKAHIYKKKEDVLKHEPKYLIKRNKMMESDKQSPENQDEVSSEKPEEKQESKE